MTTAPSHPFFSRMAKWCAHTMGRPITFVAAVLIVLLWALSGPLFNFSDTWQLVINTGTTIFTFLMVVLLQNTQNRDTAALQVKLDELIRSNKRAHNEMLDLEELEEEELEQIRQTYEQLAGQARKISEQKAAKSASK